MSFGVAEVRNGDDGVALVARADEAPYAAKANGRNCVYWHDGAERIGQFPRSSLSRSKLFSETERFAAGGDGSKRGAHADPVDEAAKTEADFPRWKAELLQELPNRSSFCQQVRYRTAEWKRGGPTLRSC